MSCWVVHTSRGRLSLGQLTGAEVCLGQSRAVLPQQGRVRGSGLRSGRTFQGGQRVWAQDCKRVD